MHLHGGKIGYLYGGPENIAKDAMELRPTYFAFVPRLLNKFYDDIQVDLKKSFLLDMIAKIGYSSKKLEMQQGIYRNDSIADRLVFGKYRGWLGGNVKVCMTGSAATDGEVMNFMRAVLGCYVRRMVELAYFGHWFDLPLTADSWILRPDRSMWTNHVLVLRWLHHR